MVYLGIINLCHNVNVFSLFGHQATMKKFKKLRINLWHRKVVFPK